MSAGLAIIAVGARTPLGLGARASALSLRAGKSGLAGAPFAGAARDQVVAGVVPTLPWSATASERAASLARGAIAEALAALPPAFASARVAVLWTLSGDGDSGVARRGATTAIETAVRAELDGAGRLGLVEVMREGEASVADTLPRAGAMLDAREAQVVLWGGAHSDVSPAALRALAEGDRLFDAHHLDAVVPGEAAAAVALVPGARAEGPERLAGVAGVGGATTTATPSNDEPVDGGAMTEALRAAMADGGEDARAGWVLSDVGYEALRLREWEVVQVRARLLLGVPYRWDALPQRFGRAGAAHLPLAAALTAASFQMGHAPSSSVVAIGGTDCGRRSAVWLRAGQRGPREPE